MIGVGVTFAARHRRLLGRARRRTTTRPTARDATGVGPTVGAGHAPQALPARALARSTGCRRTASSPPSSPSSSSSSPRRARRSGRSALYAVLLAGVAARRPGARRLPRCKRLLDRGAVRRLRGAACRSSPRASGSTCSACRSASPGLLGRLERPRQGHPRRRRLRPARRHHRAARPAARAAAAAGCRRCSCRSRPS